MRPRIEWRDIVMTVLIAASLLFTWQYDMDSGRKFCDVVTAAIAVPVGRPADPAANPSREHAWQFYEKFVQLHRSLGCPGGTP